MRDAARPSLSREGALGVTDPPPPPSFMGMGEMRLPAFARELQTARDFIEVATVICRDGKRLFGLHQSMILMYAASGRPVLGVDNIVEGTDEYRVAYFAELWVMDPFHRALREAHLPIGEEWMNRDAVMQVARDIGYPGGDVHTLALPILEPAGLLGSIYCGHLEPFTDELRRELTAAATHVSVRLAQIGITRRVDGIDGLSDLTPRQVDVAQLAARGRSNAEIATALELSENTVKKHLKDVFERLDLANRAELAAMFARSAPPDGLPIGVTRNGDIRITKVER